MGDVKLAGVMGIFLGRDVVPAIFVALIAGTVVGGDHHRPPRLPRRAAKKGIPFGPWLCLGSLVGLFAGEDIVDWYLDIVRVALRVRAPPGSSRSKGVPIPGA